MSRDIVVPDRTPFVDCILREGDGVDDIGRNDIPSQVVVCPMTVRLKLPKRRLHIKERGLDWRWILLILRRKTGITHLLVVEHSREPSLLVRERPVRDEVFTGR